MNHDLFRIDRSYYISPCHFWLVLPAFYGKMMVTATAAKLWLRMLDNAYGRQKKGFPQMSANRPDIWFTGKVSINIVNGIAMLHVYVGDQEQVSESSLTSVQDTVSERAIHFLWFAFPFWISRIFVGIMFSCSKNMFVVTSYTGPAYFCGKGMFFYVHIANWISHTTSKRHSCHHVTRASGIPDSGFWTNHQIVSGSREETHFSLHAWNCWKVLSWRLLQLSWDNWTSFEIHIFRKWHFKFRPAHRYTRKSSCRLYQLALRAISGWTVTEGIQCSPAERISWP